MERRVALQSGVVDENVEGAELLHRGGEHRLRPRLLGDVGRNRQRPHAALLDFFDDQRGVVWRWATVGMSNMIAVSVLL